MMFDEFLNNLKRMKKRQFLSQALELALIILSALMLWKSLKLITGCECPIVVVISGSMEPAFYRGDLLFLTHNEEDPVRVGDILVFRIKGREIPNVHRVIKIHEKKDGTIKFLTKGDNNNSDDRGLYPPGKLWLEKSDMVGRAKGYLPYIGMVTIVLNDYPIIKVIFIACITVFGYFDRE